MNLSQFSSAISIIEMNAQSIIIISFWSDIDNLNLPFLVCYCFIDTDTVLYRFGLRGIHT